MNAEPVKLFPFPISYLSFNEVISSPKVLSIVILGVVADILNKLREIAEFTLSWNLARMMVGFWCGGYSKACTYTNVRAIVELPSACGHWQTLRMTVMYVAMLAS